MSTTEIKKKYCRDCFYARNKYGPEENWQCVAPQGEEIPRKYSLVTGEPLRWWSSCEHNRESEGLCSTEGVWFLSHQDYRKNTGWHSPTPAQLVEKKLRNTTVEDI